MDCRYICEQSELEKTIPAIMEKNLWALDTETTGLDPHKDKVVLLQIGDNDVQYVIDARKVNMQPLKIFLESREHRKITHNGKFDYKMIKGSFGIDCELLRDTYYAEKILKNGMKFSGFGLDDLLKEYLGITLKKDIRSTFGQGFVPTGDFSKEQLEYAALDVKHLIPLLQTQMPGIQSGERGRQLIDTFILECNALPAFADMEFYGMSLDSERWASLRDYNRTEASALEKRLNDLVRDMGLVPPDLFGDVYINWNSPEQVVGVLRAHRVKISRWDRDKRGFVEELISKSDDKSLKKAKDVEMVKLLKKYRGHSIRANTFGDAYLSAVNPVTGNLHPDVEQIGTETGRPANRQKKGSINFLNIPREKTYRNCFKGDPDEVVETDDYSGCELRIWAEISEDPELIAAFASGKDVHCYVATKMYGREITKKDPERSAIKSINFGIPYGMTAMTLYDKLKGEGSPMSLDEVKSVYDKHSREFGKGIQYLRDAGRQAASQGHLYNMNGRRRNWILPDPYDSEKFPEGAKDYKYKGIMSGIEREGGNFLIQSVNADMTKTAMVMLRDYIKQNKVRSKIMNQVYDEIVTRTHKDDSADFHEAKKRIMLEAAGMFLKNVPMEVEGHAGESWTK